MKRCNLRHLMLALLVLFITTSAFAQTTYVNTTMKKQPWSQLPVVVANEGQGGLQSFDRDLSTLDADPNLFINSLVKTNFRTTGMIVTLQDVATQARRYFQLIDLGDKSANAGVWLEIYLTGNWSNLESYGLGQPVMHGGKMYIAKKVSDSGAPVEPGVTAGWAQTWHPVGSDLERANIDTLTTDSLVLGGYGVQGIANLIQEQDTLLGDDSLATQGAVARFVQAQIDSIVKGGVLYDSIVTNYVHTDSLTSYRLVTDSLIAKWIYTDTLITNIANIDSLFSNFASIDSFFSHYSEIDTLVTQFATIDSLISTYAQIDSLYADYARIDSLVTNYLSVDSFVTRYAQIDSLFTEYATIDSLISRYATIDSLISTYAHVDSLYADYARIDSLVTNYLSVDSFVTRYAQIDSLFTEYATIDSLISNYATIDSLISTYAHVDSLYADYARIDSLVTNYISVDSFITRYAHIDTLVTQYATIDSLISTYARIDSLVTDYATIDSLISTYATVDTLISSYATIDSLISTYATIDTLVSSYATIDSLISTYAQIDSLVTEYATIDSLITQYATIDSLISTYATIDTLISNYATIDSLISTYANIDSLISTYASVDTLVSSFATIDSLISTYAKIDSIIGTYANLDTITTKQLTIDDVVIDTIKQAINGDPGAEKSLVTEKAVKEYVDAEIAKLNPETSTLQIFFGQINPAAVPGADYATLINNNIGRNAFVNLDTQTNGTTSFSSSGYLLAKDAFNYIAYPAAWSEFPLFMAYDMGGNSAYNDADDMMSRVVDGWIKRTYTITVNTVDVVYQVWIYGFKIPSADFNGNVKLANKMSTEDL